MKTGFCCLLFLVLSFFLSAWCFGFEDCFNYKLFREDMAEREAGWEKIKEFESNKDNFVLEKRWPTVNLRLTPAEEKARFGTTGLEMAQKAYQAKHWDGTQMRMLVFLTIERAAGLRKIIGWRAEKNPPMPKEYLDPAFPEHKKQGIDWKLLIHWVYPPDIRGTGILIHSYNDKSKDQDTWVWFPSLRKVRRLTPSNGDDAVAGSYKTFSEGFLRRITDETRQIIGETKANAIYPLDYLDALAVLEKYGPLTRESNRFYQNICQPRECWVIRAESVKGGYCDYYKTRIWLADKEWGYGPIIEEMYDAKGKMFSTHTWQYNRRSSYDGKVTHGWNMFAEDLNFEERGFSLYNAPQTNQGYENPEAWFTLRELKRSIPTVNIPYMAVLPPKKLMPIEELYPSKELQEAYKKYFPERVTHFPGAERGVAIDAW